MRMKWICLALAALMALPCCALAQAAPGNSLGLSALALVYKQGENAVLSPYSLMSALMMVAEGAKDETLEEIRSALGAEELADVSLELPDSVRVANAALVGKNIELAEPYRQILEQRYGAGIFALDAQDPVGQINDWAREATEGLIDGLMDEAPADEIELALLNALALNAKWQTPFDPEDTRDDVFYTSLEPDEPAVATYMRMEAYLSYAQAGDLRAAALPYEDGRLEMILVLSDSGDIKGALEKLARDGLEALGAFEAKYVSLSMPKLSLNVGYRLNDALMALGIRRAFTQDAQFEPMTGEDELLLDSVYQKVRLDVDEDGTRAAAASGAVMVAKSALIIDEPIDMTANHPYILLLRDTQSGALIFAAAVENPSLSTLSSN